MSLLEYVIGVDPGLTGAIAILDRSAGRPYVLDMPVFGVRLKSGRATSRIDVATLADWMAGYVGRESTGIGRRAYVERVGAMPKQGVVSMFNFGRALGTVEAVLTMLKIPIVEVSPSVWRRDLDVPEGKDGSRFRASREYPAFADLFRRVKDHNRADAVLIAHWGAHFGEWHRAKKVG